MFSQSTLYFKTVDWLTTRIKHYWKGLLFLVEQEFVGKDEIQKKTNTILNVFMGG